MAVFEEKVRVKLDDRFSRESEKINGKAEKLKGAFKALAAVGGTLAIVATMKKSITAFFEQEKAVRQLEGALRLTGQTTDAISEKFQRTANELQKNSIFGDEAIIGQQAFLASLKFTNAEIDRIIKASVELSSATGISLDSSVRNLSKTYSGLTGELGELIPQLRGLTQEQLKNGAAVEKALELFSGSAEALGSSEFGEFQKIMNKASDAMEKFGGVIVKFIKETGGTNALDQFLDRVNDKFTELTSETGRYNLAIQGSKDRLSDLQKELEKTEKWWGKNSVQAKHLNNQINDEKANLAGLTAELGAVNRAKEKNVIVSKKQESASDLLIKKQRDEANAAASLSQSVKENFSAIGAAVQSFGKTLTGNVNASLDIVNAAVPQITDKMSFAFKTAFGFARTIVGMFASDTRSTFQKLTDDLAEINSSINKTMDRLKTLRDEENKEKAGRVVKFDKSNFNVNTISEELEKALGSRAQGKSTKGFRVEVDPETGDVLFMQGDKTLGVKRGDTGQFVVENKFFRSQEDNELLFKELLGIASGQGLNTSKESSDSSFQTGSGAVASQPLGSLTRSFSSSSGSGSTVNINAIDSLSFADFLRNRGAQVIRDVTRDEGVLLSSFRGVRRSV